MKFFWREALCSLEMLGVFMAPFAWGVSADIIRSPLLFVVGTAASTLVTLSLVDRSRLRALAAGRLEGYAECVSDTAIEIAKSRRRGTS